MAGLGWLSEYSEPALRSALRVAGSGLDQLPIELTGTNDLSRAAWASGSATIDGRFLAKFAFSALGRTGLRLLLVADFETSGVAEPAYDFRAIPSFGPGVDLLTATVDQYEELTDPRLSLERIMAVNFRTTLGDALWRSEAGLPLLLPRRGGGRPGDYVDELAARFAVLGLEP
jgi:hypothetical protein